MKGLPSTTERDIIVSLAALIGGIISAIVIALPLEELFLPFFPPEVLAGIIEEPAKVIALIYIALALPDWLTSKTKCALFGGLAGLGFAFTENLWHYLRIPYFMFGESPPIIERTLLCLPSHALESAIVGMGLLYVAAEGKEGYKKALGFLFIAIILHGLWNALPGLEWNILLLIIEIAVFGLIYYKLEDYPVPSERIGVLRLLPSKREILITRNMRTFGRKDFKKDISDDENLLLISRNHFRITRSGNEFYVEDLNSTRGTKLNGIEIKGKGRQKLNAGSEITLPAGLKIKFTTKAKMDEIESKETLREKPTVEAGRIAPKSLVKLVLPNNRAIEIREEERIFGREDFRGVVSDEELQFISREHFKIMRVNDEIYIEDLDSKNGTKLNGEEIKGWGRRKLKDGDEILVAKVLKMTFRRR